MTAYGRTALGLVGVGRIGTMHARALSAHDDVTRLTIADSDFGRAGRSTEEFGAGTAETPEALVAAGVDALVIATATSGHAPLVRLAAQARLNRIALRAVDLEAVR